MALKQTPQQMLATARCHRNTPVTARDKMTTVAVTSRVSDLAVEVVAFSRSSAVVNPETAEARQCSTARSAAARTAAPDDHCGGRDTPSESARRPAAARSDGTAAYLDRLEGRPSGNDGLR